MINGVSKERYVNVRYLEQRKRLIDERNISTRYLAQTLVHQQERRKVLEAWIKLDH